MKYLRFHSFEIYFKNKKTIWRNLHENVVQNLVTEKNQQCPVYARTSLLLKFMKRMLIVDPLKRSQEMNFWRTSLHWILWKDLDMKPYKVQLIELIQLNPFSFVFFTCVNWVILLIYVEDCSLLYKVLRWKDYNLAGCSNWM